MKKETQLLDVFSEDTTNISSGVVLENYLNRARENWDNAAAQTVGKDGGGNNDIDDMVKGRGCNTEFNGE